MHAVAASRTARNEHVQIYILIQHAEYSEVPQFLQLLMFVLLYLQKTLRSLRNLGQCQ